MPIYRKIEITDDEKGVLDAAKEVAEFRPHPSFDGVEVADVSPDVLPASIVDILDLSRKRIIQVGIVSAKIVPPHAHVQDSEAYFYGDGKGYVSLLRGNLKGPVRVERNSSLDSAGPLFEETLAVTPKGEGHDVDASPRRRGQAFEPATFFNVKFDDGTGEADLLVDVSALDDGFVESRISRFEKNGNLVIDGVLIPVVVKFKVVVPSGTEAYIEARFGLKDEGKKHEGKKHEGLIETYQVGGFYNQEFPLMSFNKKTNADTCAGMMINQIRNSLPHGVFLEVEQSELGDVAKYVTSPEEITQPGTDEVCEEDTEPGV